MSNLTIRPIQRDDYALWRPLWDGYNAFYGRLGVTALGEDITASTWARFFDPVEPVHALVAVYDGQLAGIAHYLFHRSTTKLEPVCYLQDLFTQDALRGKGIGRALIESVYARASAAGVKRVYWHTQATNQAGRALYDTLARHVGFIVYSREPV